MRFDEDLLCLLSCPHLKSLGMSDNLLSTDAIKEQLHDVPYVFLSIEIMDMFVCLFLDAGFRSV